MSALAPFANLPISLHLRAFAPPRVAALNTSSEVADARSPSMILLIIEAHLMLLMMSRGHVSVPMDMFTPCLRYLPKDCIPQPILAKVRGQCPTLTPVLAIISTSPSPG